MPELSQGEFARVVRGASITPGAPAPIEPIVMGISSIARAAVRRVHKTSSSAARSYYSGKVARHMALGGSASATARTYATSLDRYIAWNAQMAHPMRRLDRSAVIQYAPADAIRARADVVVDAIPVGNEARVLLWDELPLDPRAAEMIALPVLEAADTHYGAGSTALIHVWQLAQNQRIAVQPAAAQARHAEIQTLLAQL